MTDLVNGEIVPALSGWQGLVLIAATLAIAAVLRYATRGVVFIWRSVRL